MRAINVVQAGERTRLVFNLKRAMNYAMAIDGKSVIVTVDGSRRRGPGGRPQPACRWRRPPAAATGARQLLKNIDFRRGANGEGRIVVDLPNNQVGVDVRQVGNTIVVDFMKTGLPETLRRRLDVTDFGTPVR